MYSREDIPAVCTMHVAECTKASTSEDDPEGCVWVEYAEAHSLLDTREEKNALFMAHKLLQ